MDQSMAIGILVVFVLALTVLYYMRGSVEAEFSELTSSGDAPSCPSIAAMADSQRAWQNDHLACRAGVRNDTAGYGSQRTPHPHSVQTRNGPYLSAQKVAGAEQQAWAPYTPDAVVHFDPSKGSYAGADASQHVGQSQTGDWNEELSNLASDPRTRENHRQWANEVGPFSQGAMTVDNLDEAMVMSQHRQGITAFRALAPAQGPGTLQLTEIDPTHHADHFSKFYF